MSVGHAQHYGLRKNQSLLHRRQPDVGSQRQPRAARDAVSQEPSPETAVIVQEGQQLLLDALTRLPTIHRDILVLREMEGLSYADISQITSTAIGTVMSQLSRARAELLRSVREQFRGTDGQIKGDSKLTADLNPRS